MELLAPAGGPEQLRMAVHFGADAVYMAGKRWGMRARSNNFTDEELAVAVSWAHAQGVAVHVTINVVMGDADMDELPRYLRFLDEIGVDALIVADLGVVTLARAHAPHVALHLSTQASVMSAAAADAWAGLGVRRVVLAREMSLAAIAELRRRCAPELELEVFAHGSMCVAYSGRCLLSASLMGAGRSASKGACTQPCRWGWSLVEEQSGAAVALEEDGRGSYLLSSNDLCMIEHLDELAQAGVDSVKLEGRAKGAYYVAVVTNAYRQVLDGAPAREWLSELDAVSHRPYSTGFYFGDPTQNPGRVDYVRKRKMVGVVEECEGAHDGEWVAVVRCRNKALAGDVLEAVCAGGPVRSFTLGTDLTRTMECYGVSVPWPLSAGDVLCG